MIYYDRDGNPMNEIEWSFAFAFGNGVDKTTVGGVLISTVWLGIDHSFGRGRPLIFETMIFGGAFDEYQWRYATVEEAQVGHDEAVRLVRLDSRLEEMEKENDYPI